MKDIAYEFIKQINFEKINNPLYSKVKTKLIIGNFNENKIKPSNNLILPSLNKSLILKDNSRKSSKHNVIINLSFKLDSSFLSNKSSNSKIKHSIKKLISSKSSKNLNLDKSEKHFKKINVVKKEIISKNYNKNSVL